MALEGLSGGLMKLNFASSVGRSGGSATAAAATTVVSGSSCELRK